MVASGLFASPRATSGTPSADRAKYLTSPRSGTSVTTCWIAKFWPLMALVRGSDCRKRLVTSLAQSSDRYLTAIPGLLLSDPIRPLPHDSVNWMVHGRGPAPEG